MKWLIISVVVLSLIGSVMWAMPTPRQRFESRLRLKGRALGFQVQLAQLQLPRARGEVEAERISAPAYRLMRTNLSRAERDQWRTWRVCRLDAIANNGLPEGWCWGEGEGVLDAAELALLAQMIDALPKDVLAIESTPLQLSVFWHEGREEGLDAIHAAMQPLLERKI